MNYHRQDWTGRPLSEYLATDFENFTVNKFNSVPNNDRHHMCDFLPRRSVFLKKGRGIPILEALAELVEDGTEWPDIDEENPMHVKGLHQAPNKADTKTHQHKDAEKSEFDIKSVKDEAELRERNEKGDVSGYRMRAGSGCLMNAGRNTSFSS